MAMGEVAAVLGSKIHHLGICLSIGRMLTPVIHARLSFGSANTPMYPLFHGTCVGWLMGGLSRFMGGVYAGSTAFFLQRVDDAGATFALAASHVSTHCAS